MSEDTTAAPQGAALPLQGVRILDLTRYLSGPYATLLLAEMGAEVIKVETPEVGDDTRHIAPFKGGVSFYHSTVNRSKASVEIDLKSEAGLNLILAMVADCDVLIQNFRSGVAERLGFGYEAVSRINPKLVYCSISGFGGTGPESRRAAFDLIVQAESGVMSLNGESDSPPTKLGLPVADLTSGMFAVQGILAAIVKRNSTGKGSLVEVSMMSSLLSLSVYNATRYFVTGESPKRMGSRHPGVVPYGQYKSSDGEILLSTFSDASWKRIVDAMDRPDLAEDPRFLTAASRVTHREACDGLLSDVFSRHASEDIVERLHEAGIPCGVVRSMGEALEREIASGAGSITDVEYPGTVGSIRSVRIPIKFDGQWCPAKPAPALGQDNAMLDRYRQTRAAVAWGKEIATEVIGGIPYRMYTQRPHRVEELVPFAPAWGERPHVIQGGRSISFGRFHAAVQDKACALLRQGLQPGDRVFLVGWNSPEWIVNFWACLRAGAVPVLANAWWSAQELSQGLSLLEPALVLADAAAADKVPVGWSLGSWPVDFEALPADPLPEGSRDEEETALIIFTSGTSGQPKAVVLSHRALLARLHMTLQVTRKLPHQVDRSAHDITLITGPLFHVGGLQGLMRALVVGDTLVFPGGRFDPADVLALIEKHKVRRWNAVPTMVSRLLDHPDVARRDLSSLKSISIGGAPVHRELMQRMRQGLPSVSPRIPTGYGLTENGGQATASAGSEDVGKLGSTGRPLPCVEVKFLAHPGLPDGEILLRSPTQMSGYFGLDESPIDPEGWLHTGDLGRLDESGNLWITGRCKDMIIRGGENIAPAAVEGALMSLPGVSEAVVFGIPHADLGEEVMAVVVTDADLTPEGLAEGLRGRVASFSIPSRWRIQSTRLPTNETGKVDKKAVSAEMRAQLQAAAKSARTT